MSVSFQSAFLLTSSPNRAQLVQRVSDLNRADSQIGNLLQSLNLNDVSLANKGRADNIYWVCQQLRAFPHFKYN